MKSVTLIPRARADLSDETPRSRVIRSERPNPMTAQLRKTRLTLDAILGPGSGERILTAVPNNASNGQTVGVWIFDSRTGSFVYISNPDDISSISVGRAAIAPH